MLGMKQIAKAVLPRSAVDALNKVRPRVLSKIDGRAYFTDYRTMPTVRPHLLPTSQVKPWLDRDDAHAAIAKRDELDADQKGQLQFFADNGYMILDKLFSDDEIDRLWNGFEAASRDGRLEKEMLPGEVHPDRPTDPHFSVPEVKASMHDKRVLDWMDLILGEETKPFQSIVSFRGTDQLAHSDHVHMTTYPLGYLTAIWVALEDIHADAGPLEFYPGSHRLPYYFCRDVGIADDELATENHYQLYHERYEPFVQDLIKKEGLKRKLFHAKKGDALIWHANLLHGGSPRRDKSMTRKAIVNHYFANRAFCYHDLAATAARHF